MESRRTIKKTMNNKYVDARIDDIDIELTKRNS
jgi:hypothetical protein